MNNTTKKIVTVGVLGVIAIGGCFWAVKQLFPSNQGVSGPQYSTHTVARGNINVGVEATGTLNPSYGGSIQVPRGDSSSGVSSYIIDKILVKAGDHVEDGQPLVQLSAPGLDTQLETVRDQLESERKSLASMLNVDVDQVDKVDPNKGISLTAPIDGRVTELSVKNGTEVNAGQIVATVVNDSRIELVAKLSATEIEALQDDACAMLRFPDYYNEPVEARITDINRTAIPTPNKDLNVFIGVDAKVEGYSYVYWVNVEADNPGLLAPDMIAQFGFYDKAEKELPVDQRHITWCSYYTKIEKYVDQEDVLSGVEGVITKTLVKPMEIVKKGTPIATMAGQDVRDEIEKRLDSIRKKKIELSKLEAQSGTLTIKSPSEGTLQEFEKKEGASVSPGEWLGSVFKTTDIYMWVQVDDTDILLVQPGATVNVTIDAIPGEKFEGVVDSVSASGKDESGVTRFEVGIKVVGNEKVRSGMQGKAFIGAGSAEDVLLVPLEAIFEEEGVRKVEILDADGNVQVVPIEVGMMNSRWAEVTSGLEEGDQVITGSTSDLLPSQQVSGGGNNLFTGK